MKRLAKLISRLPFLFAGTASLAALAFSYYTRVNNLHYDGVAHLNIARRVFDHLQPQINLLGTVWLPLQHLLMLPLVQTDSLWQTGLAGSWLSAFSFILASYYLCRLAQLLFPHNCSGGLVLATFCLNPNLLYLQSTPLGEMLYVAFLVGFVFHLSQFSESGNQLPLCLTALHAALASLTRYDGWFLVAWGALVILWVHSRKRASWGSLIKQLVIYHSIAPVGILSWLLYNWVAFKDPLAFLKGDYATGTRIVRILAESGLVQYPPFHNLPMACLYYSEATRFAAGNIILGLGTLGFVLYLVRFWNDPKLPAWGFLFIFPPTFYIYNMVSGTGIIYTPSLPPYGILNVRYTALFFPALCLFVPAIPLVAHRLLARNAETFKSPFALLGCPVRHLELGIGMLCLLLVGCQYSWQLMGGKSRVAFLQEAYVNGWERKQAEFKTANYLKENYDGKLLLMDLSEHGIIPQQARIPLVRIINESTDGLWEASLHQPSQQVDWIVIQKGGSTWKTLSASRDLEEHFSPVFAAQSPAEAPILIFRKKK